jgi:glycosyltransferase involved in cell wall biosynthesis
MRLIFFAGRMPDLCGAFFHDIDLATELQRRGHDVMFMTVLEVPKEGVNGGMYRGFRFMHYSAGGKYLDVSEGWICPHFPSLPEVRRLNNRGYNRPILTTCHYDGSYPALIKNNLGRVIRWPEMVMFINSVMESSFRKNVDPWPPNIIRTAIIRPLMHEEKIRIDEPFQGDCITLVNANDNKGVNQFIDLAKRMPNRKFLAVRPYYGNLNPMSVPNNVELISFDDDIRNVLKRTRILLMPSYYESFGRIAVESMYNGIPVIYSRPIRNSKYPGGSTEGVEEWIKPAGITCEREDMDEWISIITSLDDEETYNNRSELVKQHIRNMNLFTEASRVAGMVEQFVRENPVKIQTPQSKQQELLQQTPQQTATKIVQPTGKVGFSSGRLRIQR